MIRILLALFLFLPCAAMACETLTYPPGRNPELFTRRLRRILDRANPNHAEFGLVAGVFSELLRLHALIPDPDPDSES